VGGECYEKRFVVKGWDANPYKKLGGDKAEDGESKGNIAEGRGKKGW